MRLALAAGPKQSLIRCSLESGGQPTWGLTRNSNRSNIAVLHILHKAQSPLVEWPCPEPSHAPLLQNTGVSLRGNANRPWLCDRRRIERSGHWIGAIKGATRRMSDVRGTRRRTRACVGEMEMEMMGSELGMEGQGWVWG